MSALSDGDFELDGYRISGDKSLPVYAKGVGIGAAGLRHQDASNPYGDGVFFGRDYLDGPTWQLALGSYDYADPAAVASALGDVARAWNAAAVRMTPGAESVLRYGAAGRTRRLYGRARRFAPDVNRLFFMGHAGMSAEFVTSGPLHYSDEPQSVTVGLLPGESGAHPLPDVLPVTFAPSGPRSGWVDVGGDADAPVSVRVHGPLTGKWSVRVGGHLIEVNRSLAYDQWVDIDTRKMTVLQNNGASVGGSLSRRTYLADVRLPPGRSEIVFTGSDNTGTAKCTVTWRDAWFGF